MANNNMDGSTAWVSALKPDFDNRDPLRNVRPGSPRAHSRFPVVPALGQGNLAISELSTAPVELPENPLEGISEAEQREFRSMMTEILGVDLVPR